MTSHSAEDLLSQLHELDIPSLFSADLSFTERSQNVALTKQKLKVVKKQLKNELESIKARWDGRNRYEAQEKRLYLAPYLLIDELIDRLEIEISELEIRGPEGKIPFFGTELVGNYDTGEWHIYSVKQAITWKAREQTENIGQAKELVVQGREIREHLEAQLRFANLVQGIGIALVLGSVVMFIFAYLVYLSGNSLEPTTFQGTIVLTVVAAILGITALLAISGGQSRKTNLRYQIVLVHENIRRAKEIIRKGEGILEELKHLHQ
jgi:hypothetical protein